MSEPKFNPRTLVLLAIILFISLIRVTAAVSPDFGAIANFSAVGAIALFGGAYFREYRKAFSLPLLVLLVSDLFIAKISGYGFFYGGWYWTYIAFVLMVLVSRLVIRRVSVLAVISGILTAVLVHWIVSDISAMYVPGLYPPTFGGYLQCLTAAIPFELRFLYGTAIYGSVMFGTFEILRKRYPDFALA